MDLQWDNCWIWWINPRLEKAKFHLSCMTKLYREMDFINKQRTVNIIARLWMFMQIKIREDLKLKVEICFKKYHDKVMKYLKILMKYYYPILMKYYYPIFFFDR